MDEGHGGAAYVAVVCETDTGYVELRLHGSDPFAQPSMWIGMYDPAGVLQRTWISDGLELTVPDLQRWLRPIVGYELAGRLARKSLDARARSVEDHGDRRVVRLTRRGTAKAS